MINPKDIIISSAPTANLGPSQPGPSPPPPPSPSSLSTPTIASTVHRHTILTILLTIISLDLVYHTLQSIIDIFRLIGQFRANHLLAHLFETSPLVCLFPLFTAILAVYIIFLLFKTSAHSYSDYRLLLVSSIVTPVVYSLFYFYLSSEGATLLVILNELNLLFLILVVNLLFLPRLFSPVSAPLTDQQTITFTLIAAVILFPTFFFTQSLIKSSLHPDVGLASTQTLVGYKLYFPATIPPPLRPDTSFFVDDTVYPNLPNSVVKLIFSTPPSKTDTHRYSVILTETKVTKDFDLNNYVSGLAPNAPIDNISVSSAINRRALVKSSPNPTAGLNARNLSFITTDYVLVNLSTPDLHITVNDLLTIAESLR